MLLQFARNLIARKPAGAAIAQAPDAEGGRRGPAPVRPTVTAAGAMIGAGAFVVLGQVAAQQAGPGVLLSVLAAAAVCALAALCWAELAAVVPAPGSLYAHVYATLGELPAWFAAWLLIMASVAGAAAVAVAWSGYAQALLEALGLGAPGLWAAAPFASDGVALAATGTVMDMPAVFAVGVAALLLVSGVSQGGLLHTFVVALQLLVLLVLVAAGAAFVEPELWRPLVAEGPALPRGQPGRFGWLGVTTGAALMVFAFLGFDRVWAAPRPPGAGDRGRNAAALVALAACALLFALAALVLTGLVDAQALEDRAPLALALRAHPELSWLRQPVNLAVTIALASALLGLLHAHARVLQSVSRDRLLPRGLDRVHPHTGALTVAVVMPAYAVGLAAAFLPLWTLVALASAASLLGFAVVCGGVIWLRLARRKLRAAFRAPVWWLTAPLGLVASLYLLYSLGRSTLVWLAIWLLLGLVVYFAYGYWRSPHHLRPADDEDVE